MENNIFENAYLGKPYKTRDNHKAIYINAINGIKLYTDDNRVLINALDGKSLGRFQDDDIVSEWQEEINEEELDKCNIELQIVKFNQAQSLKELGFPYDKYIPTDVKNWRPTLELVAKWLREDKNCHIIPDLKFQFDEFGNRRYTYYTYRIYFYNIETSSGMIIDSNNKYDIYEEALSAGIDKAIEMLKEY